MVRPRVPAKPAPPAAEEPVPDLRPAIPQAATRLVTVRSTPPRPRVLAAPLAESDPAAPVQVPLIAPQLTAEESAASQQEIDQNLSSAQRNLDQTRGRSLSTMQQDLTEKVRAFLTQARTAVREGDLVQARNLAHKAKLLSEELVRSL